MSTYLMHHGIKGQRWGVRRFQDVAGNLTAAGKARYRDYVDTRKDQKAYEKDLKKRVKADRKEYASARKSAYGILPNLKRTKEERKEARAAAQDARKKYKKSYNDYAYYRNLKRGGVSTYDRAQARKINDRFKEDKKIGKFAGDILGLATKSTVKTQINKEVDKRIRKKVLSAAATAAAGYAVHKILRNYYNHRADTIGLPGPVNNKARDIIDVLPNGKVKVSKAIENWNLNDLPDAVKYMVKGA